MRLVQKVVFASLNKNKFEEFQGLFSQFPEIELVPAESVLRNPEKLAFVETYETYTGNALAKARHANLGSHYPSIGDDTGLEVDALSGKPGVHSHRYAQAPQGTQFSREEQSRANIELLLSEIAKNRAAPPTARFVTALSLVIEGISLTGTGVLEGTIVDQPRGKNGFGYDPIFVPKGLTQTLAELSLTEKNRLSHRSNAVVNLMDQVKARGIVFAKP